MMISKAVKWSSFFAISLIATSVIAANAQSIDIQQRLNATSNPVHIQRRPNEEFVGRHYFNDDWTQGRVLLDSGKRSKMMALRYDMYKHQVEFKRKGKILAAKPKTFKGIELKQNGEKVVFLNGFNSHQYNINPEHLLQVFYNGKVKLLKQFKVDLNRGNQPTYGSGTITSRFRTKESYFLIDRSGDFHKIDLNKDSILDRLGAHKSEIEAYAKSKDLDFGDEHDLASILSEYDKMLKSDQ